MLNPFRRKTYPVAVWTPPDPISIALGNGVLILVGVYIGLLFGWALFRRNK